MLKNVMAKCIFAVNTLRWRYALKKYGERDVRALKPLQDNIKVMLFLNRYTWGFKFTEAAVISYAVAYLVATTV